MKISIPSLILACFLFATSSHTLLAMDKDHDHSMMKHEKMNHGSMQTGDSTKMERAKLGPAKKPILKSKKKHYLVYAEQLPVTDGTAVVEIKVQRKTKRPVSGHTKISATLYMPGMDMDLPPVLVTAKGEGAFQLEFSIPMEGFWKIKLTIEDRVKDIAILKFVTK